MAGNGFPDGSHNPMNVVRLNDRYLGMARLPRLCAVPAIDPSHKSYAGDLCGLSNGGSIMWIDIIQGVLVVGTLFLMALMGGEAWI